MSADPDSKNLAKEPALDARLPPLLRLMRPHQWIKNGFVAAPLFFTPELWGWPAVSQVLLGILAFCCLSSAVYVVNDYADREADRLHPVKRERPLAAGTVSVPSAFALLAVLLALGFGLAAALKPAFLLVAGGYFALNLAYSFRLKHIAVLDVMAIAAGFVLRVEAGGTLITVPLSAWIVIMTGLLAVFLALAKRRDDVVKAVGRSHRKSLDGYNRRFVDAALSILVGALLVAYLVYTTDESVMARLGTERLYTTAPFVVYGLLRYLQLTIVEERSGSPTTLVLTDRPLLIAGMGWVVTFALLIAR